MLENYKYYWERPQLREVNSHDVINLGEDDLRVSIENTIEKIHKPFVARGYATYDQKLHDNEEHHEINKSEYTDTKRTTKISLGKYSEVEDENLKNQMPELETLMKAMNFDPSVKSQYRTYVSHLKGYKFEKSKLEDREKILKNKFSFIGKNKSVTPISNINLQPFTFPVTTEKKVILNEVVPEPPKDPTENESVIVIADPDPSYFKNEDYDSVSDPTPIERSKIENISDKKVTELKNTPLEDLKIDNPIKAKLTEDLKVQNLDQIIKKVEDRNTAKFESTDGSKSEITNQIEKELPKLDNQNKPVKKRKKKSLRHLNSTKIATKDVLLSDKKLLESKVASTKSKIPFSEAPILKQEVVKDEKVSIPKHGLPPKSHKVVSKTESKPTKLLWDNSMGTIVFENSAGILEPYFKENILEQALKAKEMRNSKSELKHLEYYLKHHRDKDKTFISRNASSIETEDVQTFQKEYYYEQPKYQPNRTLAVEEPKLNEEQKKPKSKLEIF